MNRLNMSSFDFYMTTPLEFDYALKDYEETQLFPVRVICETLREVGKIVHNAAFGRKRSDLISDPKKLIRFGWERPKQQTVEEMKEILLGLSHVSGIQVKQKGKPVESI